MNYALADMNERGTDLSYLAPFSQPFYRRFGYEQLFEKIKYTIPAEAWPSQKRVAGLVKRCSWSEAKVVIAEIYHQSPRSRFGGVVREDWWLEYSVGMKKDNYFAIYYDEAGLAQGYLIYRFEDLTFIIEEWNYQTYEGFGALSRFIGSHSGAFTEYQFSEGFNGQSRIDLMEAPAGSMTVEPFMMGRIVNFERFLTRYPWQQELTEPLFLAVSDATAPWNDGVWKLASASGKLTISKADQLDQPVLSATIQTWTQLFMGYRSAEYLAFYGKITGALEQCRQFDQLLPKGAPLLAEYF